MKSLSRALFLALIFALAPCAAMPASAAVRVVTTLTDLAWAAEVVGGDRVTVRSLSAPNEDPHYVSPTPSLVAAVGDADLFVEVGLDLELWTERLLDGAGNPQVRPGGPGYVLASRGVEAKERPSMLSRSQGDLHPNGNPHIWLDPLNMKVIAANIAAGLTRVDPAGAEGYAARLAALQQHIDEALFGPELVALLGINLLERLARGGQLDSYLEKEIGGGKLRDKLGGWLKQGAAMRGGSIVYYHQSWVYFAERFGLTVAAYVESKPGIAPSAAHRARVVDVVGAADVPIIVVTNYYDARLPRAIAEQTGIRFASVPLMTGGSAEASTWFDLMDHLVGTISAAYEAGR